MYKVFCGISSRCWYPGFQNNVFITTLSIYEQASESSLWRILETNGHNLNQDFKVISNDFNIMLSFVKNKHSHFVSYIYIKTNCIFWCQSLDYFYSANKNPLKIWWNHWGLSLFFSLCSTLFFSYPILTNTLLTSRSLVIFELSLNVYVIAQIYVFIQYILSYLAKMTFLPTPGKK